MYTNDTASSDEAALIHPPLILCEWNATSELCTEFSSSSATNKVVHCPYSCEQASTKWKNMEEEVNEGDRSIRNFVSTGTAADATCTTLFNGFSAPANARTLCEKYMYQTWVLGGIMSFAPCQYIPQFFVYDGVTYELPSCNNAIEDNWAKCADGILAPGAESDDDRIEYSR